MKKQIKKLTLVKEKVSTLNAARVVGGLAPGGGGSDPVGITDYCPPSLPHTDCYCGSDFKNGCGSIIGHC